VKDFYESGPRQRALDLQHMEVDRKTGDVYIPDSQGLLFRLRDWKNPRFEPCLMDAKTRINASSIAIDARGRHLYTKKHYRNPIRRWTMDGEYFTPAPLAARAAPPLVQPARGVRRRQGAVRPLTCQRRNEVVPPVTCSWVFTGLWERGMAAAGGVATLGVVLVGNARIDDYTGPLTYFKPDKSQTPWPGCDSPTSAGRQGT